MQTKCPKCGAEFEPGTTSIPMPNGITVAAVTTAQAPGKSLNGLKVSGVYITDPMLYGGRPGYVTREATAAWIKKIGSWLAGRSDLLALLFKECDEHDIEPCDALALMQKEQSALFRRTAPTQHAMDWLYGYGCPEGGGRQSKFQGIENQIAFAIRGLRNYDTAPEVHDWEHRGPVHLYDAPGLLADTNGGATTRAPRSKAEAASLHYNPRMEGLTNQTQIWWQVFNGITNPATPAPPMHA